MAYSLSVLIPMYMKAYRMLEKLTPLQGDCGKLCGSRCCGGDDSRGMLLFPHERFLLTRGGYRITQERMGNRMVDFAVCDGNCDRHLRPLSCRIFPFAPRLGKSGEIQVKEDPRAKAFCPLLSPEAKPYLREEFIFTVQKAFEILGQSKEMSAFLKEYTEMLEQYDRFFKKTD